jgi:23S rRNA pseudouridine1911/1915/1917 synthase
MALAKTSKAARRLHQQFLSRSIDKYYLALTQGVPPSRGRLEQDLWRAGTITRLARASEKGTRAILDYEVLGQGRLQVGVKGGEGALLAIKLLTGLKHQIRAQLASLGFPLVGDQRYGAAPGPEATIGLWACQLGLTHPVSQSRLVWVAWPGDFWPWSAWEGPAWTELWPFGEVTTP